MHRWCNVASSAVDHMFNLRLGQTKGCKLAICCYSADHAAVMSKSKDGWSRNQDNESEWGDLSTHGLLFQWACTLKIH